MASCCIGNYLAMGHNSCRKLANKENWMRLVRAARYKVARAVSFALPHYLLPLSPLSSQNKFYPSLLKGFARSSYQYTHVYPLRYVYKKYKVVNFKRTSQWHKHLFQILPRIHRGTLYIFLIDYHLVPANI